MKQRLTVLLTALVLVASMIAPAWGAGPGGAASAAEHSTSPVLTLPVPDAELPPFTVVGSSQLVRTDRGVSATLETSGLEPGHVVTLWWIVANAPERCQAGLGELTQCGPGDHLAGRGEMSVHYGAGRIVTTAGSARYGANLRVGDTSRVLFEGEPGLTDARGAEVILLLKTHGPKTPGTVSDQLRTFAGGCDEAPEDFLPLIVRPEVFGTPGDFENCAETQISVHSPK